MEDSYIARQCLFSKLKSLGSLFNKLFLLLTVFQELLVIFFREFPLAWHLGKTHEANCIQSHQRIPKGL